MAKMSSVQWGAGLGRRATLFALLIFFLASGSISGEEELTVSRCKVPQEALETEPHKCWVLTHLQKCGGSTLKHLVGDYWGHDLVMFDSWPWLQGTTYANSFGHNLTHREDPFMLSGAYTEALRASIGDKCKWSIVFRHPISRLVSAYFYCKRSTRDTACAHSVLDANEVDLVDFARHWGNFGLRQLALAFVPADDVLEFARSVGMLDDQGVEHWAGWYLMKRYLEHKGETLGGDESTAMYPIMLRVREMMEKGFAVVGLLEEFATTLELFDCVLRMPDMDWSGIFAQVGKHNVGHSSREEKEAVLRDAWTNPEVKKYMDLDLLVYEHAVDVFNSQVEKYGLK